MVRGKIFAIDFDNTIAREDCFPDVGELLPFAKEFVNRLYDDGAYIIIWTSRDIDSLHNVEKFLSDNKIKHHSINNPNPAMTNKYGNNPRKVGADWYLDDKTPGLRKEDGTFDWITAMSNFYDFEYCMFYAGDKVYESFLNIDEVSEI